MKVNQIQVDAGSNTRAAANLFLLGACIISLGPLLLVAFNAFKAHPDIVANPLSLPHQLNFTNFARAWKAGRFSIGLQNSLILSLSTVFVTLAFSSLAAFALARKKIAGWKLITIYFLCATTVPIQLFLFPLYFVFSKLGLVGNPFATSLIIAATSIPISTFLLRAYIVAIPSELDDAAFMDGASPLQTFFYVILPLLRPGLVTVAIIVFLNVWNEYLITATFQSGRSNATMTIGYLAMNGTYATDQGALMAGAFILVAPIVVFFLIVQRFFVAGMTAGAVKG